MLSAQFSDSGGGRLVVNSVVVLPGMPQELRAGDESDVALQALPLVLNIVRVKGLDWDT